MSFSPDGEFIKTSDVSGQCRLHLFKISNIINIRRQLRRGITPSKFLMLKLLAGLKDNWEYDYPHKAYPTCPADITCALIQPKLPKLIQLPKGKQKKLVKSTYDWVLWNLNEFKKIKLSDDYTFYDLLCKTYHIEDDPIVQHPDYENNGLVAPGYLIPYVRLMTIQKHNTWWDDQGLRIALAPLWYLEQYLEASSPDYLEEESSELFDASSLSNIN